MARVIKMVTNERGQQEVLITDGNSVQSILVDENNEAYREIRDETNNFTENMAQKDTFEQLQQTQINLIFQLMMNGVL